MSTTLLIATAFDPDGSLKNNFIVANNLANVSVTARTIDQNSVTTDYVTEGIANLYYTDARARLAISVTGGGFYDNANGIITVGGPGLNTTNVIEGANLYFTNARARAAISNVDGTIIYNPVTGEIRANVTALGGGDNVVSVNGQTGVVTLSTSSIAEGSNLYFTNARARAALTAGQGISINNGQVNVDATANVTLNELFVKSLTIESASNANANIVAFYDGTAGALIINSNVELDQACVYHIGTINEPLAELHAFRIETNTLIVANSITADEFVGNLSGEIVKTISVTTDNNSLVIDTENNPDLFLPKGTKVNFNVSADSLIGIGFDIGNFDASNNEIQNGGNLLGLSYIVNGAVVPTYDDWAASFNDSNTRSITYLIPQGAAFNTIYYAIQFNQWRGNVVVAPPATTDDLNEGSINFYHTPQRVYDILSVVTDGNVGLIYDEQNNLLTMEQDLSIGATPTFGNVTANSFHGGIFYGTFVGNITGSVANLNNLSTTDLKEGANGYFTVSRLRTNLSAANGITYSSILGRFELSNTNVTSAVYGTANTVPRINVDEYGRIQNVTPVPIFINTTSVAEGTNLYYTDARVVTKLQTGVEDIDPTIDNSYDIGAHDKRWRNVFVGTSVVFNDNTSITTARLNTDTLIEGSANLWYTNDRVWANVGSQLANVTANVGALTTTNVAEGANLYFTNARAQAAIFGGVGVNYIAANGQINLSRDQTFGNVTTSNLVVTGNLYVLGNTVSFESNSLHIDDPLIYLAANNYTSDVVDIGFIGNYFDGTNQRHAGLFRDATDKEFKLFDNVLQEATVEIDTANTSFRLANLHANYIYANIVGQVSSLGGLDTDDLPEGTANLYFTNARVWANISPRLAALTTDDIAEGITNVYYSNTRVINDLVAGVLDIEPAASNVYDIGAHDRFWRDIFTNFVVFEGNLRINSTFFDTANIVERSNLYFTNTRARAAIGTANATSLIYYENNGNFQVNVTNILGTTVSSVNGQTGTVLLTTANIAESGANLYFSNTRVGNYLGAVLQSIVPNASNIYDLGSQAARWRDLYLSGNSLYLGDLTLHDDGTGNLKIANATTGVVYNLIANTGSLIETGSKVFFSNDRVWANVSIALANVTANVGNLTTTNVAEGANLYFTTNRVWANVGANIGNLNAWLVDHNTTTGIAEGTRLYFTNARSRAAVGTADTNSLIYYEANGRFQVNVETIGTVTSVNGQTGTVVLTTSNVAEGANRYFTDARAVTAVTNTILSNLTVGNVSIENDIFDSGINPITLWSNYSSALKWRNTSFGPGANADTTITAANGIATIVISTGLLGFGSIYSWKFDESKLSFPDGTSQNTAFNTYFLTTSNVVENTNLYFTNARVWANVAPRIAELTTTQIAEGANLYFSNTRTRAAIGSANSTSLIYYEANGRFQINVESVGAVTSVNGQVGAVSLTTSNVAEGANLYFSNARALAAVGGQYVGTTNAVTFANVTANVFSGNIGGGANNQLVIQLASNITGFLAAPNVDYTFLRYDSANGIVWGPVPGANTIAYLANSIALDPSYGTYNSGNVLSIQTVGDYNLDANNYYSINETATTPGYIAYIDFTTVQTFNRIVINLFYTQNSAHVIYVDLWNKDTLAWDSFGSYNGLGTYYQFALAVLTPEKYIEANGLVEMRLYHASAGNTGHNHRIDYVALEYSTQGPQGPKGTTGSTGATGAGVATGGDTGQILYKANSTNYATYWGNLITSNVEEGANLWFTNTRVRAAVGSANTSTLVYYEANGNFQVNVEAVGAVTSVNGQTGAVNLTTTNIAEGANLYFTNARTRTAVSGGLGVLYNQSTGVFSLAQNVSTHSDVTFANLTVTGNLTVQGNALIFESNTLIINDPLIQIGKNPVSGDAVDLGFFGHYIQTGDVERHAGLFRDATDGNFKLFTNLDPEPVTIVDTANASFRYANLFVNHLYGNVSGFINTISNFSTTNLTEGANLYFTNTRARAAVGSANQSTLIYYEANGNFQVNVETIGTVTSVNGQTGVVNLTTANIAENGNLYYTDNRVWSNVGTNIGNLNAWSSSNSANIGNLNTWVSVTNSNVGNLNSWLSTTNSNIGNLNTWVSSSSSNIGNLNSWLSTTNSNIGNLNSWISSNSANIGLINASLANINSNVATLTTTGIAEGANLYFTNTRARAAVGAVGSNLTYYEANGRLQFIVPGGNQQLIFNNNGQLGASSGLYYDGVSLKVNGNMESLYSNGSEGGEFFLNKAASGTTIDTGVTIDVNGDRLRFFERGGTNRGFYIDITTGGSAAGTNLVGGGGGTVTSVGSYTGAVSNAQLLGAVQSGGTSISFDQIHSSNNSYGTNFKVGDDAWIGDYNSANAIKIKGQQDAANGYVSFGSNSFALGVAGAGELTYGGNKVYHAGNDGAGSGLDADLLDNNNSSYYTLTTNHTEGTNLFFTNTRARAAVGTANASSLIYYEANGNFQVNVLAIPGTVSSVNGQTGSVTLTTSNISEGTNQYFTNARAVVGVSTGVVPNLTVGANGISFFTSDPGDFANITLKYPEGGEKLRLTISTGNDGSGSFGPDAVEFIVPGNNFVYINNNTVWNAGNDGSGSGLDADLLDGQDGSYYASNAYVNSLTTTQIAEGANLYFTNTRARAAVGTANSQTLIYYEANGNFQVVSTGGGGGGAVDSVNGQTGVVVLTTANIAEAGGNLYFTNSRSRAALTAGQGITYIEANGYIAANLLSLNYATAGINRIVLTEGQVNVSLSGSISDINQYMVYLNGVLLDANVDYSNTTSNIVLNQPANVDDVVHVQKSLVVDTTNFVNSSFQNVTLNGNVKLQHKVFTDAILNPANGAIQSKYVTTNTTFTDGFTNGDNMVLHLNGGSSYAINWPNMRWVSAAGNTAPTLTANDTLVFWKIENELYGIYSGSSA